MLALRVAQRAFIRAKVKNNTKTTQQLSCTQAFINVRKKRFHSSPKVRWVTPQDLNTPDLRKECERRGLETKGNRTQLVEMLTKTLQNTGGYDNGLTTDNELVAQKREIETKLNQIPEKHHTTSYLYVEERYQKKIASQFQDERIKFNCDASSHVRIEGRYADVCHLRAQITDAVSKLASKETTYSLPHHIVLRLNRSVLADIRRSHDVNFTIMRHKNNGEDMMLLAIEGSIEKRMAACEAIEQIVDKLKSHSITNVAGIDILKNKKTKSGDPTYQTSLLRESAADCFNIFQGVVLYLDPRMREMIHDYQSRLDAIGEETRTNVYVGTKDLFWLNDFQLAIEGASKDVSNARQQIDTLMNELKLLTMTLVLPSEINEDIAKESKPLASSIQKQLGVDAVIIQQNDRIYVHLIGKTNQVNTAAGIIDSRCHKLNKNRGNELERIIRRDRIRNLNFVELGVGGLDETLRDMLRRTFESRLISNSLRKELGLQHVRGVLLYGPPGTGKTLIARKISQILGCDEPKLVNGPEVESKWVGEAEKNIRNLFEDAQTEFQEKGDDAKLHVVIFDEIDAIAKKRGGAHAKSRDGALNQLLCCLDGIQTAENILVFGLTNRKDCLDNALLRPGRLEVQLEIGLPDVVGRLDILKIHTQTMRNHGRLHEAVNLRVLAEHCDQFSGADIAGMIRSAVSYALENLEDEDNALVTQEMLQKGLQEVRFSKERLSDDTVQSESNSPGLLQA